MRLSTQACSVLSAPSIVFVVVLSCLSHLSAEEALLPAIRGIIEIASTDSEWEKPFRFDSAAYRKDTKHLPIGVFDSRIGGLTVLEAIFSLDAFNNDTLSPVSDGRSDFANERFVYLGDQANMPYGNYAAVGKESFLRELIAKDAVFLLGRRYWPSNTAAKPALDKPPVKAIVIACNTATAYGLEDLRGAMKAWSIPVFIVGVVEAGARGVAESIATTDSRRAVAVLATTGTCSSMAYPKAINMSVGLSGKRVPEIIQQGSVGLAGAIEGDRAYVAEDNAKQTASESYQGPSVHNAVARLDSVLAKRYGFEEKGLAGASDQPDSWRLNSISNYARYDVFSLVEKYRQAGGTIPIDTVVLGCTHFPLVQTEILTAFGELREYRENGDQPYLSLIAKEVRLVNPAELTAKELFRELAKARLRIEAKESSTNEVDQFYISVPDPNLPQLRLAADGGLDREYKYTRTVGQLSIEDTRIVPMTTSLLPESSLNLIRTRLPNVWNRLSKPKSVSAN